MSHALTVVAWLVLAVVLTAGAIAATWWHDRDQHDQT